MPANKIEVRITGANQATPALRQLQQDLQKTGAQAKNTDAEIRRFGQNTSQMGGGLGGLLMKLSALQYALAALPFAAVATQSIKMAAAVEESNNLFRVSMGDMADAGDRFAKEMQSNFGLLASDIKRDIGMWNAMFRGMGINIQQSYQLSTSLSKLTEDMVSLYNLPHDLVWEKLRAGIVGEAEPLRQLGILVDEATVETYALQMGLIKQGQEMTAQQKVVARYNAIMAQTKIAQGDLARTADSTTNQFRRLENGIKNLMVAVGESALPGLTGALKWLNLDVVPRAEALLKTLKEIQKTNDEITKEQSKRGVDTNESLWDKLFKPNRELQESALRDYEELARKANKISENARNYMANQSEREGRAFDFLGVDSWIQRNSGKLGAWAQGEADRIKLGLNKGQSPLDALIGYQTSKIKNVEDARNAARKTGQDIASMGEAADFAANELLDLGADSTISAAYIAALGKQVEITKATLESFGSTFISAYVAVHPATKAASERVKALESAVASTQRAIDGNAQATRAASQAYQDQQEKLSGLNEELQSAKQHLQELQNVQLKGMGAMDAQSRAIDRQIKQLRLQQLALYQGGTDRKGDLTKSRQKQYDQIQRQIDDLQRRGETISLKKSLTYDEQLRKIKDETQGGPPKEVTYQQAMADAKATYKRYQDLTKQVEEQEKALKQTQKAMESISDAGQALNDTLKIQQDELATAKKNYDAVTQALTAAYQWYVKDRDEIRKLGPEGQKVADEMDADVQRLMSATERFAKGELDNINDMWDEFEKNRQERFKRWADAINAMNKPLPQTPTEAGQGYPSVPVTPTSPNGGFVGRTTPRAEGGEVWPGQTYLVGEKRPELFTTRTPGLILPSVGGSTNTTVIIQLNSPIVGQAVVQKESDIDQLALKVWSHFENDLHNLQVGGLRK